MGLTRAQRYNRQLFKLFEEAPYCKINALKELKKAEKLNYKWVSNTARELGLTLAEYGDGADYTEAEAYCYWNKTGNRQDKADIYIEYDFDITDDNGRFTRAGTVRFLSGLLIEA